MKFSRDLYSLWNSFVNLFVRFLFLSLLSTTCTGQVLADADSVSSAGGVLAPVNKQQHPITEALLQQQQVFGEVFTNDWTPADSTLELDQAAHDDFLLVNGLTNSNEPFDFEIIFAITIDLHAPEVPDDVREQLLARQFQWSVVTGYLTGPLGRVPVAGSSVTIEFEGVIHHTLSILERVDDQSMVNIENMQLDFYRTLPVQLCLDQNGDPVPTDSLYEACYELNLNDMILQRACLKRADGIGMVVGGVLTVGCWGFLNVLGAPLCYGVTASYIIWMNCMTVRMKNIGNNYIAAQLCCCTQLKCRNAGGEDCSSSGSCSLSTDYCNDVPCMPF